MLNNKYEEMANGGMSAEKLARLFLKEYFQGKAITYPINPFQMLTDLRVPFVLRPFKKYEGVYIPRDGEEDFPIVGINLNRPIARQRYTAAHELCHHLKDANKGYICSVNAQSEIERYAEAFASELLMPTDEFINQVNVYAKDGCIDFEGVLRVAHYFGVSFKACLLKIAYHLHMISGDTSPKELDKRARKFKPQEKREELGYYDTLLYEQLFDAIGKNFLLKPTKFSCQRFKNEYIYNDSRMEGIDIEQELAAEIVIDLRDKKQDSKFCKEENQNIIEVAGLSLAYDYAFENAETDLSIYNAKEINKQIYATAPCSEYGGMYRQTNTLVLGAKFETIDYQRIPEEMYFLDKEIKVFMDDCEKQSISDYVENVIKIHHRLTVIHAFRDGNGRTSRAFANMMLMKRNIPPVFFTGKTKNQYKDALKIVDTCGRYDELYEAFFKAILSSYATLSDFMI